MTLILVIIVVNVTLILIVVKVTLILHRGQLIIVVNVTLILIIIVVNVMLIVTVFLEKTLHEPVYVFLCNLWVNGLCGASAFYLKLLHDLVADAHVVTYAGCLTRGLLSVFCEFTGLTVMVYDRYLAVCRPLRYRALMALLLLLTWCFLLLETAIGVALTAGLPLSGCHIDKIFCTNWEVVKLSCIDTTVNRKKFVQTCLPHLAALLVFTSSLVFDVMYSRCRVPGGPAAHQPHYGAKSSSIPHHLQYGINLHQIRTRILQNLSHKPEVHKALS
ncbi:LOW QUALITY PROTEIN: putative olfactory receptor 7A2 [Lycodopsis pacificus]